MSGYQGMINTSTQRRVTMLERIRSHHTERKERKTEKLKKFPRGTRTHPRLLTRNSPGLDGVTSLTNYHHARMASLASQDAPTYNLQPHPTSPSPTISYFILVLPVANSPSPKHHTTLSTLPNVSHIARCIIPQLITTPATLSIWSGVTPRVSVADHCSIVPCIAKTFPMRRGI